MTALPSISLLIVVRNQAELVGGAIDSLLAQHYPAELLDLSIIDNNSSDGTLAAARQAVVAAPFPVRFVHNEAIDLASGWNLGIQASQGRYVLRLDGHSRLPPDYLRRAAERLLERQQRDPAVVAVGGRRRTLPGGAGAMAAAIAAAQRSRFGVGAAAYRFAAQAGEAATLAVALYDRRVFERCGWFRSELPRTEDNEFHARVRRAGWRLFFDPELEVDYLARPTLKALARQMAGNGFGIGWTWLHRRNRGALSWRHAAPALAPVALLLFVLAGWLPHSAALRGALALLLAVYVGLGAGFAVEVARRAPRTSWWRVLLCFWVMHASYAAGEVAAFVDPRRRLPTSG